ncbi:MAG: Endonuclease [Phycisphaerales bacterium]|nr:Endonuclease [Phycisphaerales bacterium]
MRRDKLTVPTVNAPPHSVAPAEWGRIFKTLRAAVAKLPQTKAAMFMLADEGFASVFEQVVSAIISVRTTEEVTLPASRRLLTAAKTPATVAELGPTGIAKLIAPCTFAEGKARDIHAIAVAARDQHGGKLPCDVNVLDAFRGVGPKVANLAIAASPDCGEPAGIPVDIHVHRVANRWAVIATTTPEKTQFALQDILPRKYWAEINMLLVPFGKFICTGVSPKCSQCPLNYWCMKVGVTTHR